MNLDRSLISDCYNMPIIDYSGDEESTGRSGVRRYQSM